MEEMFDSRKYCVVSSAVFIQIELLYGILNKKRAKQSRYRRGVAQRVPGS